MSWIVVDSGSTDGTREIAAGARCHGSSQTADWPGFGAQKNRALARGHGRDFVFSIDADERVTRAAGGIDPRRRCGTRRCGHFPWL